MNQQPSSECEWCPLTQGQSLEECPKRPSRLYAGDCTPIKALWKKRLQKADVPLRFEKANLGALNIPGHLEEQAGHVNAYAADLKNNLKSGQGLILKGSVGTLKTTLAVAVLQEALSEGLDGMFVTMPSLLDNIFTLKEVNPEEWVKYEARLRKCKLLVLDDLGYERSEGWVTTKVDAIISERYNGMVSTIATTNLTAGELKGRYAQKLLDRLGSTCQPITFSGPSLRAQKREAA